MLKYWKFQLDFAVLLKNPRGGKKKNVSKVMKLKDLK